ncbi:MAG: hypothetical protein Q7R76_06405 [Candidatus Woesearchaeota archaeon]|nr:hypothetical protein [Candidatus Woesearchaeota archaeon]
MDVTILKERETPLLARKRVTLEATYDAATPSRVDLTKAVAKKVGADEKLVSVRHIYTRFGKRKARIIAHIYADEKDLKLLEGKPKGTKKAAEQPAA